MKKKIFITNSIYIEPIVANLANKCKDLDFELFDVSEAEMLKVLRTNKYDLALINPLLYGMSMNYADLRILPETCIAHVGYTGVLEINFSYGSRVLDTVMSDNPNGYEATIAKILLSERYDLEPNFVLNDENDFDTAKLLIGDQNPDNSLDLSEDWYDTYEIPLPLAFWCGKNEEIIPEFKQLIKESAQNDLNAEFAVKEKVTDEIGKFVRGGSIITRWNDDVKLSLEQTLQILYLRGYFPNIPAVKLLGDNEFLKQ